MPYRTVSEVMTSTVVSIGPDATYREIVALLTAYRVSAVPVLDAAGRPLGVVSATDLLRKVEFGGGGKRAGDVSAESGERSRARSKATAATAAELMSVPAFTISRDTAIAAAARMMDSLGVKRLSVVDDKRRVVGIVTRTDLLRVFLQSDEAIRDEVLSEVAERMPPEQARVDVEVSGGVVALTGELRWRSQADGLTRLARAVPGVVDVVDRMRFRYDDVDGCPES